MSGGYRVAWLRLRSGSYQVNFRFQGKEQVGVHRCSCSSCTDVRARTGTLANGAAIDPPRRVLRPPSMFAQPGPLLSSQTSSPARRLQDFPAPSDLAPEHSTGSPSPGGGPQPPGNSDGASAPSNHAPIAASRYANTERPC